MTYRTRYALIIISAFTISLKSMLSSIFAEFPGSKDDGIIVERGVLVSQMVRMPLGHETKAHSLNTYKDSYAYSSYTHKSIILVARLDSHSLLYFGYTS